MTRAEALKLFSTQCEDIASQGGKIECFVPFECPISIVDADVKEYVIDEYDTVELFVLRLYDGGIRTSAEISDLTGISASLIDKILRTEMLVYGHIDPNTGAVTDAGKETIAMNVQNENAVQQALYSSKRELQVDALTGTLIKAGRELLKHKMDYFDEESEYVCVPLSSVQIDNELSREIEERLQFYMDNDYMKKDTSIDRIEGFTAKELKYRNAFYVKMEYLPHPFILISWYSYKEQYIAPIAISQSDSKILNESEKYLVRRDSCFEHLMGFKAKFMSMNDALEMEDSDEE